MNVTVSQFRITDLIGSADSINDAGYYRYAGSLTTPGCNEGVIWNVAKKMIPISAAQVKNYGLSFKNLFIR